MLHDRIDVTEECPNCGREITMVWDIEEDGYKAFCPVCGNRLMLCDMCHHRGEGGEFVDDCDYDSETDTCRFNQEGRKVNGGWFVVVHDNYAEGMDAYTYDSIDDAMRSVKADVKTETINLIESGYNVQTRFGDDGLFAEVSALDGNIYYQWKIISVHKVCSERKV